MAALRFQPEAPASTLWLGMITGEAIRRISEGFVIKGDSTKAGDNKTLGLGAKQLGNGNGKGSPGQTRGGEKTHSFRGKGTKMEASSLALEQRQGVGLEGLTCSCQG